MRIYLELSLVKQNYKNFAKCIDIILSSVFHLIGHTSSWNDCFDSLPCPSAI